MSRAPRAGGRYLEWTIWVVLRPALHPQGLALEWEGERHEIAWDEIERAFAAEVGEPEGVRAIVFDLAWKSAPDGPVLLRFSFDPSDGPKRPAQLVLESLGEPRCSASLRSLAHDGRASDRFSHVDLLDEALLDLLARS